MYCEQQLKCQCRNNGVASRLRLDWEPSCRVSTSGWVWTSTTENGNSRCGIKCRRASHEMTWALLELQESEFPMSKVVETLRVVDTEAVPVYAVNTEDAAAFVGLSVKTLANMRSDGTGPKYLKVGSKVLYRVRDLETWIDSYC